HRRADLGQPRGRSLPVAAVRGRGPLRLAAAARALPLQTRRLSRRDLAALRPRRLAARPRPLALPPNRPAPAPPRRRRLPGQRGGDGVAQRLHHTASRYEPVTTGLLRFAR